MLWDPLLKLDILKFVLAGPVNNTQDSQKNAKRKHINNFSAIQTQARPKLP